MNQITLRNKVDKPPICPKLEKVSTVRIDFGAALSPRANKIQREGKVEDGLEGSPGMKGEQAEHSPSIGKEVIASGQGQEGQRKLEYRHFTRKNYFKSKRNLDEKTNIESNLTEKIVPMRESADRDEQKRLKSKSALNYAKYFIRNVSTVPTEPSSNNPNQQTEEPTQCPQDDVKRNMEGSADKKANSIFSHQERQKSRKKISERLKSIKNIRARSNKAICSIQKNKELQKNKQRESPKKIAGNITSLSTNQSNVLRMKARARNKRVILKVKQYHSKVPENDVCLMMSSKIDRSFSQRKEVLEKIELHLQLLNLLPAYVKQFKEIYEESECWQELIFLVYKKFYIERMKVQLSLQSQPKNQQISLSNPFRFNFCLLTDKDLFDFKSSLESYRLQQRLSAQNSAIKQSLRHLYNHIIQKSGKHINLYQLDNFSQQIYYLMNEQLKLLAENQVDSLQGVREKRIGFIIKCCMMIAFLNGESVEVDSVLTQSGCSQKMRDTFNTFIQYYTS